MSAEAARVLIVDGEAPGRSRLRATLEKQGHRVDEASTGREALAALARDKAAVVICDMGLPDMKGLDLMDQARKADPGVEFLLTQGDAQRDRAYEAIRGGAQHILQKPVDLELLAVLVTRILEGRASLSRARQQLLQAAKLASLGELAAGVAHELNNPLTSVIGFSHWLLKASNLAPEQREDIERIHKEAKRCGQIVQNMLQFARRKPAAPAAVELKGVVNDALELFRCTCQGVTVSFEANGPGPSVNADRPQLQQALLQLLGNARDAVAGRKEPKISVRVLGEADRAVVEVQDNGCGIPASVIPRIFDPFFSSKPQGQGSGLGLSVAYGIVKQHDGAIDVSSAEGQGTRMRVVLPAVSVAA